MSAPVDLRPNAVDASRRSRGAFGGTVPLIRLILRRDRITIGIWCVGTVGLLLSAASTIESTYPGPVARQDRYDQVLSVPMFVLFQSQVFGSDVGALVAQQAFAGVTLVAALGAILLVVRHTRGEEQAGRRELLGGSGLGPYAPLAAVLTVVLTAGVVIAVSSATGLIGAGLPVTGSLALAAVVAAAVSVAAGFAAVTAQLLWRSSIAGITAFGAFYALHLVRGFAHVGGDGLGWLGWLTPNGWLEQVRPFTGNRWGPLLAAVVLSVVLLVLAAALETRRDLGAAFFGARPGPAQAAAGLRDPLRLAWRLHLHGIVAVALGLCAIGLAMGAVGGSAMTEYADAEWVRAWAAALRLADPGEALLVYVVFVFVFLSAAHAVFIVLRLRTEEVSGLAGSILSTRSSRTQWAGGHLAVALTAPLLLQFSLGVGLGLSTAAATGDPTEIGRALGLTLPLVPAVWILVGITFLAFGLSGRSAPIVGWIAVFVGIAAEVAVKAGLPEVIFLALSPFGHVSPYYQPSLLTYLVLTLLTATLVTAGLVSLRRRDLVNG